jgi:RNA 2',3'-cyclic 3'-phosphodiesterase
MRLFTGIDLPEREKSSLDALLAQLRPLAPLRWSPAANLHITTKFIGEWPEARLDELGAVLSGVPNSGPIAIDVSGLGWFPNPHQPRIFWASVKAPPELGALAAATEGELKRKLGIAAEEGRPYRAHLTLARLGSSTTAADLGVLRRAVAALPSTGFGSFEAAAFHLYLSEAGRYTKLASYPLLGLPGLPQERENV